MANNISTTAAIALLLVMMTGTAAGDSIEGKVVAIADGDTLTVLADRQQVKIRVAGIDAPEKNHAFGQRSKEHLSDCAFDKVVIIDWKKIDRYGRTIGKVSADGVDCGLRQVKDGMAWHYKSYAKEQTVEDRAAYSEAEALAVARKVGLWNDVNPIPPWNFRHHPKANGTN